MISSWHGDDFLRAAVSAVAVMFASVAVLEASEGREAASAQKILESTGVRGGLVVHLGCGDGKLTAALRANDSYLVQGLDALPS